jgi:uncharacterized cupin superfamily protein
MTAARDQSSPGPFDLSETPIHLSTSPGARAPAVALTDFNFDGESFMKYIGAHCSNADAPGRLIMVETTATDWPTWERHPEGDEIVIVLEGKGDFIQQIDGNPVRMPVEPGSALINPAGIWHTADIQQALKAIYITPCPGTDHKPR